MGRYNLLDEKWIMVLREDTGQTEKVSLKEVFAHAGDYYDLAGEMKTQDFAVLRVLLAVLQTVFSKFDSEGNPYDFMEIDKKTFRQLEPVDREDLPDDEDPFFETWLNLWKKGEFPEIVQEYLEAWRDHFYLFDDKYPFYQVTPEEMEELAERNSKGEYGTKICGKNINRTISESGNKIALFAPIKEGIKDNLQNNQLARWLIMYQGYSGTGDKTKARKQEVTYSKGWLYDLGGVYLRGDNLFETLMLNCVLSSDFDEQFDDEIMKIQIPSWERSPLENVDCYFFNQVDNRAGLYTNWSRAISFDKNFQDGMQFQCFVAKLPEINHVENFMEPMTRWKWNDDNKKNEKNIRNKFTPKKHSLSEAVWSHFNALLGIEEGDKMHSRQPGVISWYHEICRAYSMRKLQHYKITICSVSMQDDGNSSSWVPIDEIIDEIQMETAVLIDDKDGGWNERIITLVNKTESFIKNTLIKFVGQVALIRLNMDDDKSISENQKKYREYLEKQECERIYMEINQSFREWLYRITENDEKDDKALEWYCILKKAILNRGEEIFNSATFKDLKGIWHKDKGFMNIATAYNEFKRNTNVQFNFLRGGKQ